MDEGSQRDIEAFTLRSEGRSFGAIARELGFDNAPAATDAFLRVLQTRVPAEQEAIRVSEYGRLDALADHVRADESLEPLVRERRLAVIDRLRERVDAAAGRVIVGE